MSDRPVHGHDAAPWVIIAVGGILLAFTGVVWLGGTLGAAIGGAGWHPPALSPQTVFTLIADGPRELWPGVSPAWVWTGVLVLVLAFTAATTAATTAARRYLGGPSGLARRRDLPTLLPQGAAEKARRLRPSLAQAERVDPDQAGVPVGDLEPRGPQLRSSWEDVMLALMGPRMGKSAALVVPAVLGAPGPVVLTSNKYDVLTLTRRARSRRGTVWVFDPQGIAHATQAMWWDMLAEAKTIEGARRLASHFVTALADDAKRSGDFWFGAALNTLTALFHAAARTGGTVTDVLAWLANPADRGPIDGLRDAGMTALADQLQGTVRGAVETRDGIYETARQCVACLLDPGVSRWVIPDPTIEQFRPAEFVGSRDTLYLLSKDGGGSAAGVIAAAADAVMRAGVSLAERSGGRVDPPLLPILDEAANVCRIADLPDLYSHLGSRGIPVMTVLQSYRQGVRVWGEAGMDSLWSAATVKILGAGLDDADFAEKISRLVGDHKVAENTVSRGTTGRSVSTSRRRERILTAADIRAIPKFKALLLVGGTRVAMIRLRPWFDGPHAAELAAAAKAEELAITVRAREQLPS